MDAKQMCAATFNTRQITDTGLMYQRRGPLIKCDVEFKGQRNGRVLCFGWASSEVFFCFVLFLVFQRTVKALIIIGMKLLIFFNHCSKPAVNEANVNVWGEGSKPHVKQGATAKSKPYVQQRATAKSKPHVQQGAKAKAKFHMPDSVWGLAHMGNTIPREPEYFRALLASINKLHIRDGKMEWGLTQETVWINIEENEFASGAMRDAFKNVE